MSKPLSPRQLEVLKSNQFRPGVSGNPAGRRAGAPQLAREVSGDGKDCFLVLAAIMNDGRHSPRDRADAARTILAYQFGKPLESQATLALADSAAGEELTQLASGALEVLARSLADLPKTGGDRE